MERKSDVLVTFILPSSTSCVLHQAATAMHGKLLLELWGSADTNQVAAADLDAHYYYICTAPNSVPKYGPVIIYQFISKNLSTNSTLAIS